MDIQKRIEFSVVSASVPASDVEDGVPVFAEGTGYIRVAGAWQTIGGRPVAVEELPERLFVFDTSGISASSLSKFQETVGVWARKTFPVSPASAWLAHLQREAAELSNAHDACSDAAGSAAEVEEAADCLLLLLGFAHIRGFDLLEAAGKKFRVNQGRRWGPPDHDGVTSHVDEPHV